MWPWEHIAFGYLLYSPLLRIVTWRGPDGRMAVLLAFGAVLPDLVDKTLSWGLGVFPTGYALGHSVFVALPLGVALLARFRSVRTTAFVAGYWSHLLGDVLDPLRRGAGIDTSRILWPVVVGDAYEESLGLSRGLVYFTEFVSELPETDLTSPAILYLLLPGFALLVWLVDGAPGVGTCRRLIASVGK